MNSLRQLAVNNEKTTKTIMIATSLFVFSILFFVPEYYVFKYVSKYAHGLFEYGLSIFASILLTVSSYAILGAIVIGIFIVITIVVKVCSELYDNIITYTVETVEIVEDEIEMVEITEIV